MDALEVKSGSQTAPAKQKGLSPKQKKWGKRLVLLAALALAGWFFLLRPMSRHSGAALRGQYLSHTAQVEDLTVVVDGSGILSPIDSYRVTALVTGEVLEAPFAEGDWVEKGDLLYRMDAGDAELALEQAQLALRQAQLRYDDLARGLTLTAGTSGVVQSLMVKPGDLVSPGSPLAEIADTTTMTITLPFLSADAAAIQPGQTAVLTLADTLETLPATVEALSSADLVGAGGALTRQVKLRVDNPGALTSGRSATASIGGLSSSGSGLVEAGSHRTLLASAAGEVEAVHVLPGSRVEADTVLVELGGASADSSLENAALGVENARLGLRRAQEALDHYTITAPISGTVIEKNFKAGDKLEQESLTAAGGALAVIYDMSTLTFDMSINDLDINKVQVGQPVTVTSDALKYQSFQGHVDKVHINGRTAGGFTTYPITIRLEGDGNALADQGLKPGMNIKADILVEQAGSVLCLPIDAVGRGDLVKVAGEGALNEAGELVDPSKLEDRQVKLGRSSADKVEILEGLEQGDVVYTHNPSTSMMSVMMG